MMIPSQSIIIANNTTSLRPILLILMNTKSQISQLAILLLNIQNITQQIQRLIPIGINFQQLLKNNHSSIIIMPQVLTIGLKVVQVRIGGEPFK